MQSMHPKDIGDQTTLAVMLALRMVGLTVLLPFGENTRYDLVIDDGRSLARVQCKTGRLRAGAVLFNACSTYAHHRNPANAARDYLGEIDFFAVYCAETEGVYLVPIEDAVIKSRGALRVDPPRNGQVHGIRLAAPYQIGTVSFTDGGATAGLAASAGAR